ncbi:MAG: carbon-nitrogen hydrolase family protein [Chlorobiaceae bacterium]|nr:carbon-nitrogen hydrolase family protein [Chlorobiaceae bacterium]
MARHVVAVVQMSPVPGDSPATVERLIATVRDARQKGVELIVFPEAFIGGYPKGADFHISIGIRQPAGREEFRHYFEHAITVPGPETDRIAAVAMELNMYVMVGVIERTGGTLYCSSLLFGPNEGLVSKHRKLMPTAGERYLWGQGDGSTLPVVESPIGRIGSVICWENYMPMLRMAMYAKGIEIYCAPTVDDRPTWFSSMQHIALEGRCFVLSACQLLRGKDMPAEFRNCISTDPEAFLIRGGSCIVNPLGQVVAGPVYDEDALLIGEIDMGDIARSRFDFDPVGHYSRPDVFTLTVNEAPMNPVNTLR